MSRNPRKAARQLEKLEELISAFETKSQLEEEKQKQRIKRLSDEADRKQTALRTMLETAALSPSLMNAVNTYMPAVADREARDLGVLKARERLLDAELAAARHEARLWSARKNAIGELRARLPASRSG